MREGRAVTCGVACCATRRSAASRGDGAGGGPYIVYTLGTTDKPNGIVHTSVLTATAPATAAEG
jgi:hypothetical protein